VSLFPKRTETRASGWETWENGGGSPGSSASPTGLVPFFASIRHIVDFLSTLPVDGYRMDGDNRAPMGGLPTLLRRLNDVGDIGAGAWVGQWAWGQVVDGNSVGWITATDGYGFPIGVRWLRRHDWSYDEHTKQWYAFGIPAPRDRIVHSPWIVPAGCTLGVSPVEHFKAFWAAGKSAQEYADVGRGGGTPPAILKNNKLELDPVASREIQKRVRKSFASGDAFVSGKDWDLTMLTAPPNQAQFLNTLQLTANQTAAIFGIDPREIGGSATESLTYATDESRALNRANNMRPYLERFEAMVARLLPERQYIKLNVDATIRTDLKTQTEVLGLQIADGRVSVNEARALKDLPPVAGGDFHNVPTPKTAPQTAVPPTQGGAQ
jgi:HK97 family phage portal protein